MRDSAFSAAHLALAAVAAVCSLTALSGTYSAVSPDGRSEIRLDDADGLRYSVWRDGVERLKPASIDFSVRGRRHGAKVVSSTPFVREGVEQTRLYKKCEVSLAANGRTLTLDGGYSIELIARNDGVAYRWVTDFDAAEVLVDAETAPVVFASDDLSVWLGYPDAFPDADQRQKGLSNWESVYTNMNAKAVGLKTDRFAELPIVVEYPDGACVSVSESDQRDYPGWVMRGSGKASELTGWFPAEPVEEKCEGPYHLAKVTRHDYLARTSGRRTYPWRLFIVADSAAKLCEGDAPYALAEPCRLKDTSWIRPGLAQWEWWNAWNVTGVDFRAGINTETYFHYIDFAAEHGVPYVIVDGGWSKDYAFMNAIPGLDLRKVCAHANEKGVGIILWSPWIAFDGRQEEFCRGYAEIGVKGFKLDGICRNDRYLTSYLEKTAAIAAKYRQVIDYHGCSKPSGLSRTYPNILNYEGVHGLENTKWEGDWMPKCDFPQNDISSFFCRMSAGPMDYTPGAMDNFNTNNYHYSYTQPGSCGTRIRQLAMFVMYEAPFQMLCDSPSNYRANLECFRFMASMPTVWDETRGLAGKLCEYAAVARRSGETWHVGVMTDWTPRTLSVDTGKFLSPGVWQAEIFEDGPNADRKATDWRRRTVTVRAGERLEAKMAPGGAWTARFTRSRP